MYTVYMQNVMFLAAENRWSPKVLNSIIMAVLCNLALSFAVSVIVRIRQDDVLLNDIKFAVERFLVDLPILTLGMNSLVLACLRFL